MELCTRFYVLIFGLILFLSCFLPFECRKLNGYKFPVYSTKYCPRNLKEWNQRSSAINCTNDNGYVCLPNENITELLEFCYSHPFILIEEGICLFLSKRYSLVDSYSCTSFSSGCPNSSLVSYHLFKNPQCTSIGNGCFLAEPSCQSVTSTSYPPDATEEKSLENNKGLVLIGTTCAVFIIICFAFVCVLLIKHRKGIRSLKIIKDVEKHEEEEEELLPCIPQNQQGVIKSCVEGNGNCASKEDAEKLEEGEHLLLSQNHLDQIEARVEGNGNCASKEDAEKLEKGEHLLLSQNQRDQIEARVEGNGNCASKEDAEKLEKGEHLLLSQNQLDQIEARVEELPLDHDIIEQWKESNKSYVETKASKEVEKLTKTQNLVIVTGHSGSGKSAILRHIALKYRSQGWNVKPVVKVENIIQVINFSKQNLRNITLFVLNDPIGKDSFDEIEYNSWGRYEENLEACLKNVKLLLSCRFYILNDNRVKGMFKDKSNIVDISNEDIKLNREEKERIWYKYASKENVPEEELEKILETEAYFPLLCKLYFSMEHKPQDRLSFFKEPIKYYEEEIIHFRRSCKEKYCALVLLVLNNNKLCVDDIWETATSENKFILALKLCEMEKHTAPHTIDDALKTLQGFFVEKIGDIYKFYHDFVMEVTTYVFGKDYPLLIIKYADTGFLRKRVKLKSNDNNDQFTIYLSDKHVEALGKRLFNDIFGERLLDVVLNPCLKNEKVIDILKHELENHPEKLEKLLEKKKFQMDKQEYNQNSNHIFLSKLVFVSLPERISPLCVILIFCETSLSLYCLKALQQMPQMQQNVIWKSLFSSVCCNGSKKLFDLFTKDSIQKFLTEKWNFLYPIHIASAFNNNEILCGLINNGADVNLRTTNNSCWTPLTIAAGNNAEECDGRDEKNTSQSRRNDTVQLLLSNGAAINLCRENGASPLHIACQEGYNDIAQLLLSKGADINSCMKDGASPLFKACQKGHENTVEFLLHNKANIDLTLKDGTSPLYIACREGYHKIVKLLLKNGANLQLCIENESSPLHVACKKGHKNIVQNLLSHKPQIDLCMNNGASPVYIACQQGHYEIAQMLLKESANTNLCTKNGTSPLYIACENGNHSLALILLKAGADINLCKKNGASPLYVACQKERKIIVYILLKHGADINLCVENGASPLYVACQEGHNKIVHILLTKGADIDLCKKNGASPLYIACQKGHNKIVQQLLRRKADTKLCMEYGASPLIIACQHKHNTIVELLLKNGADVNFCVVNGSSPLITACQYGHDDIVQILLRNGADLNLCNEYGTSPLISACKHRHHSTVELLRNNGAYINADNDYKTSSLFMAC